MILVFPQIYKELKNEILAFAKSEKGKTIIGDRQVKVTNVFQPTVADFPYITIEEKSNVFGQGELGNKEKYSLLMYEVNIYDNSHLKVETCYSFAPIINAYMTKNIGFKRVMCEPISNIADADVFRIVARFQGYIDNDTGTIYNEI